MNQYEPIDPNNPCIVRRVGPDERDPTLVKFGYWFRELRVNGPRGWIAQRVIAAAAGIDTPRYSRIELGYERPTAEEIVAIAGALRVDPNYFALEE